MKKTSESLVTVKRENSFLCNIKWLCNSAKQYKLIEYKKHEVNNKCAVSINNILMSFVMYNKIEKSRRLLI